VRGCFRIDVRRDDVRGFRGERGVLMSDELPIKQVIVIRKDLKMRRGKEIAQGAHASMAWLSRRMTVEGGAGSVALREPEARWLTGRFAKVCLQVESEAELLDVHARAQAAGLESQLITDAGHTEFHCVPTNTCVGIGPDYADKIDAVTGSLKLY
jgi:PTH2 family peptidyl-tRNA hydrolase